MATWGSQTWGFASWGLLGDQTVELSGLSTTTNSGSVTIEQNPGWGTQYWGAGEWGDLSSPEALVTGIQSNINVLGENRIPYSENLNDWGQNVNYTITSNLTSPNGTVAQSLQQAVTASQLINSIQPKPDNNEEITYSFYAKNVVSGFLRVIIIQGNTGVFLVVGGIWPMVYGVIHHQQEVHQSQVQLPLP